MNVELRPDLWVTRKLAESAVIVAQVERRTHLRKSLAGKQVGGTASAVRYISNDSSGKWVCHGQAADWLSATMPYSTHSLLPQKASKSNNGHWPRP